MIQHHLTYFGVLIFVFCTHCTLQLSARVSTLVQLPSVTKVERHRISNATKAWAWHTTAWQIDFMCVSAPRIRWRSTWWWSFAPVVSFLIESSIWATSLRHGSVWQKGPPVTSPLGSSHIMCGLPPGAGCDSDATDVPWLGWCDHVALKSLSPNYKLQQAAVAVCSFFGSDVGEPNKHTSPHRTRCSLLHAPEKIVSQGRGRKHRVTMLGMWLGHETSWNHSQGVLLVVPNAATICSCTYSGCWRLPLYTDVILSYSSFWMISVRFKFNLPFHHFQRNFTNVLSAHRGTWRLYTLHPAPGFEAGKFLVCHQGEDSKAWTLDDWNGRIQQQWVSCCIPWPVPDMKSFTFDAVRCSLFPGPFLRSSTLVWPMKSSQMWCAAVVLGIHLSFQLVTGFITISHSFWSMANYDHFFKFITVSIYLQFIYLQLFT